MKALIGIVNKVEKQCESHIGEEMEQMNKSSSDDGRLLVHGGVAGGDGEGAAFPARLSLGVVAVLVVVLAFFAFVSSAFGVASRPYQTSFGSFAAGDPQSLTVDQSNGDVYVYEPNSGEVARFTSAGAPDNFTSGPDAGTNTLTGLFADSTPSKSAVAIDRSGGPADGDIYVTTFFGVNIYTNSGTQLGSLEGSTDANGYFSEACGVAVDQSNGVVYIGDYEERIWRYTPSGGPVTEASYSGGIATAFDPCQVAAGSGSVYAANVDTTGPLYKFAASSFALGNPPKPVGTVVDATATAVATDPSDGEVYVDEGNKVSVFSSSGASLYSFGSSAEFGSTSVGVAVKGGNGKAYVADSHAGGQQVDVFSQAVNVPAVATTNAATTIHHTDAVLNGHLTLGTNGVGAPDPITNCHFDWGTTNAYTGGTVPCNEGNSFNAAADVSANLGNLTPGTLIHFRLDITGTTSGTATGADQTVTPTVFPVVHEEITAFGPDGTSATRFSNGNIKLAFDQSSRKLYELSAGTIGVYGFNASLPPAFPILPGFTPLGLPGHVNSEPAITVGSGGNVYVASQGTENPKPGFPAVVYGFSPTGTALGGNFPIDPTVNPGGAAGSPAQLEGVAADSAGNLWVSNAKTKRILEYDSAGNFLSSHDVSTHGAPRDLAFDSNNDLYVNQQGVWRYTAASGYTTATQITPIAGSAIAIDPPIHRLYVARYSEGVDEYDSSGGYRGRFASNIPFSSFVGVTSDATNHYIYVNDAFGDNMIHVFGPGLNLKGPTLTPGEPALITGASATLSAKVDPETFAVTDCHFEYGTDASYGHAVPCAQNPGSGSGDVGVSAVLSGLASGTVYHFRIVAANANNDAETTGVSTGPDQTFTTLGAQVHGVGASQITTTEARLTALVNPEGKATTYHFDYGTTTAYGSSTPESASVGFDSTEHAVVKPIGNLAPGTTYHFRIVATNADGTTDGADTTFMTDPAPTGTVGLPDGRAYELVTNPDGGDSEVYEPEVTEAKFSNIWTQLPFQASFDGNAMAYVGSPSAGGNEAAGYHSGNQYVVRRSGDGEWARTNISPVGFPSAVFEGFSGDLSVGFLDALEGMAPGAPGFGEAVPPGGNYDVLYTAGTKGGAEYVPFITAIPPYRSRTEFATSAINHPNLGSSVRSSNERVLAYAGASADSSHVLFEANDALTAEAEGGSATHYAEENNLYEFTGGQLRLVNILPNGSTKANATFGAPPAESNTRLSPDFSHVISGDGSRVFWTDLNTGHIYVRENGTSTVEISSAGQYWTATADGSKVFYTNGDLYEYEVENGHTTDLTPGVAVQGVIGASEDGAYVYYVTSSFDLDVWHNGITSTIKTLTAVDNHRLIPFSFNEAGDWKPGFGNRMAEVSPDGRGLVFMSTGGVAGYPSVDVYEADTGQVYCASCGSRGSKGFVPLTFSNTYLKRWISEDGTRVFFDSYEALVPQDVNGKLDAYEWERPGAGSCKASTGCIYILSGGTSGGESYLADASANGDDVFIVTRAKLLSRDDNELYDLYDARVGGVEPVSPSRCTGTGCQGTPSAPPIFATPSSVTFAGVGNFAAPAPVVKAKQKQKQKPKKPKPKHKVKRHKVKKGSKAGVRRVGSAGARVRSARKGGRS